MEYRNNARFIHYTLVHGVALQDANGYFGSVENPWG